MAPPLKNSGPLLVDKVRGYFDRLPEWLRSVITVRIEKQKVDSKVTELDPNALQSELIQEVTDEKLQKNTFLGAGEAGSGNDAGDLPASHLSEVVLTNTGQVAGVTETVGIDEDHLVEGPPLQDGSSEQVGDLWVTKRVEAPTFDAKVFQVTREDLIPKEFKALVPEKVEAHTVDGEAALPTLVSGDISRKEEQVKVGVKTVSAQTRDLTTPPVLTGQRFDPEWNGVRLVLEQKIVPADTDLTQAFGTTEASIKPIDGTNALQETWKAASGSFPIIIVRNFDAELQSEVSSEYSIVAEGSTFARQPLDVDWGEKKIDAQHSLRQIDRVAALPNAFDTYETQMLTFPALLSYLTFALVPLATAGNSAVQWTAGVRAQYTTPARVRTRTEFFTSEPTSAIGLYRWKPSDIIFKGLSYSLNLSNILTDAWNNIGVTFSADTTYGNAVDRFSITATSPSATSYLQTVNTEQAIAVTISKYKRLWVRRSSYTIIL